MAKQFFHFTHIDAAVSILKSSELRPSSALECNDPFEFDNNPFFILFKNLEEVTKYYKSLFGLYRRGGKFLSEEVRQKISSMTPQQLEETMARAIEVTKKSLIPYGGQYLFKYKEEIPSFDKLRSLGVIYCFSRCNISDSILLWGHYARSHTGVAFGFDFSADKYKDRIHKVEYPKDLRRGGICSTNEAIKLLSLADSSTDVQSMFFKKTALNKHKSWSYENEWRMISVRDDQNPSPSIKLNSGIFKSVYLGLNMSNDLKKEIFFMAKSNFPDIDIYEAEKDLVYKRLNFTLVKER